MCIQLSYELTELYLHFHPPLVLSLYEGRRIGKLEPLQEHFVFHNSEMCREIPILNYCKPKDG